MLYFTTSDLAAAIQNHLAVVNTDTALEILHDNTASGEIVNLGDEPTVGFGGARATFTITTSDGRTFTVRVDEN